MSANKRIVYILLGIILIGCILWVTLYECPARGQKLVKNGKYSIATITGFEAIIKRRSFTDEYEPTFTFPYKGQIIKGRGAGIIQTNSNHQIQKENIGNRYLVVFLPDDPQINSLLPYEKFADSLPGIRIANADGQIELLHPVLKKEEAPFDGWTKSQKFGARGIEHLKLDLVKYEE